MRRGMLLFLMFDLGHSRLFIAISKARDMSACAEEQSEETVGEKKHIAVSRPLNNKK